MSCSCKQANKISKKIPSFIKNKKINKGWKKKFLLLNNYFGKIIGGGIVTVFMVLSIPVVSTIIIFNYIRYNKLMISFPSFIKKKQ